MNEIQRRVLLLIAAVVMLMALFPPFQFSGPGYSHATGYHFITSPQDHRETVNAAQLVAQIFAVAVVGAALYLAAATGQALVPVWLRKTARMTWLVLLRLAYVLALIGAWMSLATWLLAAVQTPGWELEQRRALAVTGQSENHDQFGGIIANEEEPGLALPREVDRGQVSKAKNPGGADIILTGRGVLNLRPADAAVAAEISRVLVNFHTQKAIGTAFMFMLTCGLWWLNRWLCAYQLGWPSMLSKRWWWSGGG